MAPENNLDSASNRSLPPSAIEEIGYWEDEFSLQGTNQAVTKRRLDPDQRHLEFPALLRDPIIPAMRRFLQSDAPIRCVEIGSGPMSTLAWGVEQGLIEVSAVDVLADEYARLHEAHNLPPYPVRPVRGSGEALFDVFEEGSFHIAYASNSIDHTDDCPAVFDILVRAAMPSGLIVLQHHLKEGTRQNWSDSHKWNLDIKGKWLTATNQAGEVFELSNRDDIELVYLNYRSELLDGWIDVVYRKL